MQSYITTIKIVRTFLLSQNLMDKAAWKTTYNHQDGEHFIFFTFINFL